MIEAETDGEGRARASLDMYDGAADIHLAYCVDVVWPGDDEIAPCAGPSVTALALTPARGEPYPYDGYFAEGTLFLSPAFMRDFPEAVAALEKVKGLETLPPGTLEKKAEARLEFSGVLKRDGDGGCRWIRSVHAPRPLNGIEPMLTGDEYV